MKRLLPIPALAVTLFVGGCVTAMQLNDAIAQIRATTQVACGFLPAATVVAEILSREQNVTETATGVAARICAAAGAQASANPRNAYAMDVGAARKKKTRARFGTVNGVRVKGQFVRRARGK